MRQLKPFWDEPKHIQVGQLYFPLPLPRVFSPSYLPQSFPYLSTSSLPKPKFIFSPPGLASFFSPSLPKLQSKLRKVETQGSLELQPSGKTSSLKINSLSFPPF